MPATRQPLYPITRRYTRDNGLIDPGLVEAAAIGDFASGRYVSLDELRAAHAHGAEYERAAVARKIELNAAWDAKRDAEEAEAQAIAARMSIAGIEFEIERRKFGSFCTTADGSAGRQQIYRRALEIAKHGVPQTEAAE